MKRLLASFGAALIALALCWIAGFDFDERGKNAVAVAILALSVFVVTYIWPGWWLKEWKGEFGE